MAQEPRKPKLAPLDAKDFDGEATYYTLDAVSGTYSKEFNGGLEKLLEKARAIQKKQAPDNE